MKGFHKVPSQHLQLGHSDKVLTSTCIVTTEAQTLEQALHILDMQQKRARAAGLRDERNKNPTLKQQKARAAFVAAGRDISLANGDVRKGKLTLGRERRHAELAKEHIPHPFRDLPEADKPAKARAMLASGNWGLGAHCGRELACIFGVDRATMASWLGIEV